MFKIKYLLLFIAVFSFVNCSSDSSGTQNENNNTANNGNNASNNTNNDIIEDSDNNNITDEWDMPDPLGRITENNLLKEFPEMYIITSDSLKPAWEDYLLGKNLHGIHAEIMTVEDIENSYSGSDSAEKLRNFLKKQHQDGNLRFVLMGGDAEVVPFRRIFASITIQEEYTTKGPAQIYFANLTADFDKDNDGVWGEKDEDLTLSEIRETSVAVGRVPVSHDFEVANYAVKVSDYEHAAYGNPESVLLMSDIATTLPIIGDVDAAEGVETTYRDFFPDAFKENVRKLYATEEAATMYDGEVFSVAGAKSAIEEGYYMFFHNGHGSHSWLTYYLDSEFINSLENNVPCVLASCSCLAGNYADIATPDPSDTWPEQNVDEDSAGEYFIISEHAGVAYLGNTGTGLGAIGGSQFLHAFYKALFVEGITRIGEAANYGRAEMRDIDYTLTVIPSTMTDDSEWWTHLVVELLGDPSLPVWTKTPVSVSLEGVPSGYFPGWQEMTFVVKSANEPVEGVTVVLYKDGDFMLRSVSDNEGKVKFSFIPQGKAPLHIGVSGESIIPLEFSVPPVD